MRQPWTVQRLCRILAILAILVVGPAGQRVFAEETAVVPDRTTLVRSVICEGIDNYAPLNPGLVFSINLGRVSCYTDFDPVTEETHIYHKWYFRDRFATRKKLSLKPPRWATFSSIQLRREDKGPWRVEVVDSNERILDVLRFSITD